MRSISFFSIMIILCLTTSVSADVVQNKINSAWWNHLYIEATLLTQESENQGYKQSILELYNRDVITLQEKNFW